MNKNKYLNDNSLSLSILSVSKGIATKSFIDRNGQPEKSKKSTPYISEATARRYSLDTLADLIPVFKNLTSNQCITYGITGNEVDKIVTKLKLKTTLVRDAISRSKYFFKYSKRAIAYLDFDGAMLNWYEQNFNIFLTPALAVILIRSIFPAFKKVQFLSRYSVSSCFKSRKDGKYIKSPKSFHLYFEVSDGENIPQLKNLIMTGLWLAGYGQIQLSKPSKRDGVQSKLVRGLVDCEVWQPERVDFAGGANIPKNASFYQDIPEPILHGTPGALRVGSIEFTPEQKIAALEMQSEAKKALSPQIEENVVKHVKKSNPKLPHSTAVKVAKKRIYAHDNGILPMDTVIQFSNGKSLSLAKLFRMQFVDGKHPYHGFECADPDEPEYNNGVCAYFNCDLSNGGQPNIYSFAHGNRRYSIDDMGGLIKFNPVKITGYVDSNPAIFQAVRKESSMIAIKSPMGSGKTTAVKKMFDIRILNGDNCVLINSLSKVAQSTARALGFPHYMDKDCLERFEHEGAMTITYNSMFSPKFEHAMDVASVVILDEVNELLEFMFSDIIPVEFQVKWIEQFKVFLRGKTIVLLDAHLDEFTLREMAALLDIDIEDIQLFVRHDENATRREAVMLDSTEEMVIYIKKAFASFLTDGKPFAASFDNKSFLRKVCTILIAEYPEAKDKILSITGDDKMTDNLIADAMKGDKCLFYTPAVARGFDLNVEAYETVFQAYFGVVGLNTIQQMTGRARQAKKFFFAVNDMSLNINNSYPVDTKIISSQILSKRGAISEMIEDVNGVDFFIQYKKTWIDSLYIKIVSRQNESRHDYVNKFKQWIAAEFDLTQVEVNEKDGEIGKDALKEAAATLNAQFDESRFDAEVIDGARAQEFVESSKAGKKLTDEEQAQLDKYMIMKHWQLSESELTIEYVQEFRRNGLKHSRAAHRSATPINVLKALDILEYVHPEFLHSKLTGESLKKYFQTFIENSVFLDGDVDNPVEFDFKHAKKMVSTILKDEDLFNSLNMGLTINKKALFNPIRWINRFLNVLGHKVKSRQKRVSHQDAYFYKNREPSVTDNQAKKPAIPRIYQIKEGINILLLRKLKNQTQTYFTDKLNRELFYVESEELKTLNDYYIAIESSQTNDLRRKYLALARFKMNNNIFSRLTNKLNSNAIRMEAENG